MKKLINFVKSFYKPSLVHTFCIWFEKKNDALSMPIIREA